MAYDAPIRVGGVDEIRRAIEMVEYVFDSEGTLIRGQVPRTHLHECGADCYFENLGTIYQNLNVATRIAVQDCAERIPNESKSIRTEFYQNCPGTTARRHRFNQRDLNYDISRDEQGRIQIDMNLTYKLRCNFCHNEDSHIRQLMETKLATCLERTQDFFSTYDIVLNINPQFLPFGEEVKNAPVPTLRYSWGGSDLLIIAEDRVNITNQDSWNLTNELIRNPRRSQRGEMIDDRTCMRLTRTIAQKLGFQFFTLGSRSQCPSLRERTAPIDPYNLTFNSHVGEMNYQNTALYPETIRNWCAMIQSSL